MRLESEARTLRLAQPFATNKGSVSEVEQIFIRLRWREEVGVGTVVCKDGAMAPAALRAALDSCGGLLAGANPFQFERLLSELEAGLVPPAVLSAVDMALHDLLGKAAGLPLHRLWGLEGRPLPPTAISLGQLPDCELIESARRLAGWPIIKLKMTKTSDPRIAAEIRKVYAGRIWIDANGAWDLEEAVAASRTFQRCGVELLEQPLTPGSLEELRQLRARSPLPIVADEDCSRPEDLAGLRGCVDAVNIKLLKSGGLRNARVMAAAARSMGLKVMLGCKTESALGITAMSQLAGLADYLDLDGHLEIVDDPFSGTIVERGNITLPQKPGLGAADVRPLR